MPFVMPALPQAEAVTVAAVDGGLPQLFVLPRRAGALRRVALADRPAGS
ncbi:hypothetical protein [Actinacidiphila soli]|nr:hypothetical protein [Actinacidiphila soli]